MKIGFSAQLLGKAVVYRGGIGTYIRQLLRALPEVAEERGHELHVFWTSEGYRHVAELGPTDGRMRHHVYRLPQGHVLLRKLWEQLVLPVGARRCGMDVVHLPDHVVPFLPPARGVVATLHDAAPILMPETFGRVLGPYKALSIRLTARLATRIIAISQATKRDLVRLAGARPERVHVVYYGLNPVFRPVTDPARLAAVRARYRLPERFLIYVGTIEPRKNVDRILQGYALARARHGVQVPLVLAGQRGWLYQDTVALPERLGISEHVRWTDYIPQHDLPAVYSQATALVFPTLYEGFGLPLLEAMACGTPVITANVSAMPEVVGDAALLVDPLNVEEIGAAIDRVSADPELRARLAVAGPNRARQFTWERAARETVAVYEEAVRC